MRIIAFYLPQFHPIPENDNWWNPGFTEWVNVARARPLFPGHLQPRIPGELGFYDLRLTEIREQQASLAKRYGINGFCYYHYWFAGKLLLERPIEEILRMGSPDINFCMCWANESWTANWIGRPEKILISQTYPGEKDHYLHFSYLSRFFKDRRYIKIEEKPLFIIHKPLDIPDAANTLKLWRLLSKEYLGNDLYLVGFGTDIDRILSLGYDGAITNTLHLALSDYIKGFRRITQLIRHILLRWPRWVISYKHILPYLIREEWDSPKVFPCILPNWDHTPRLGRRGLVLKDCEPQFFYQLVKQAIKKVISKPNNYQMIFIRAWNEWAEGNYLEPDLIVEHGYLEAIYRALKEYNLA